MELMTSEQRDRLLESISRDAFHLELRDEYNSPVEVEPRRRWRAGESDDYTWLSPWLDRVRAVTSAGRRIQRLRVITEPATDYIRWEHSVTRFNVHAGEEVRWLPRHRLPPGVVFPVEGRDWWLFDDAVLTIGRITPEGRILGSQRCTEPDAVTACVALRDRLWPLAIPHHSYTPA